MILSFHSWENTRKNASQQYNREACVLMFIIVLFTIANHRISLGDHQWMKKMWYIYNMDYYSAKRKKEIMSLAKK
jgi:hypothetical protein